MNEELVLAVEELRCRPTNRIWFVPIRLTACTIPDRVIGAGETLNDLQRVDLFKNWDKGVRDITTLIKSRCIERTRNAKNDHRGNNSSSSYLAQSGNDGTLYNPGSMSQTARKILWQASQAATGRILVGHSEQGRAIMIYGGPVLVDSSDPKRIAAYQDALSELLDHQFLEETSDGIFAVTHQGYQHVALNHQEEK